MKRDVGTALSKVEWQMPGRYFKPDVIVDIGKRVNLTTNEFAQLYPEAKIYSVQFDNSKFLSDQSALAYHDNVVSFKYKELPFNIDEYYSENLADVEIVDYLSLDLYGYEKDVFAYYTMWAGKTKAVKARLGDDYNYKRARVDLEQLGFKTWGMFNGISFYVLGEHYEVERGNSTSLRA